MKKIIILGLVLNTFLFLDAKAQIGKQQPGNVTGTQQAPNDKAPIQVQPVAKKKKKSKKARPSVDGSVIAQPTNNSNNGISPVVGNSPQNSKPGTELPNTTAANANNTGINAGPSPSVDQIIAKSQPIVTKDNNGSVDWTNQYIEATGESVIDNDRFKNPAQAKAMATRGAVVVAQRNLLEETKGVSVVGETTVKDMITSSDYVYSRVEGVVKGAVMVGQPIEANGTVKVTLRMPLYATNGLASALYNNLPDNAFANNNSANGQGVPGGGVNGSTGQNGNATSMNGAAGTGNGTAAVTPGNATGLLADAQKLVFNLGGKKYDPSMFPIITDANGNLLLDLKKIYDPNTGQFPQMVQASKQILQDLNMQKGVQVLDVIQSKMNTGKIVLSPDAVKKVNWTKVGETAAKVGKFLMMFL